MNLTKPIIFQLCIHLISFVYYFKYLSKIRLLCKPIFTQTEGQISGSRVDHPRCWALLMVLIHHIIYDNLHTFGFYVFEFLINRTGVPLMLSETGSETSHCSHKSAQSDAYEGGWNSLDGTYAQGHKHLLHHISSSDCSFSRPIPHQCQVWRPRKDCHRLQRSCLYVGAPDTVTSPFNLL